MTKKIIFYCTLCILSASTGLHAQFVGVDWNRSVAEGDWNSTASWDGEVVPTASDNVRIREGNVTVSAAASANELLTGLDSTVTVNSGGVLTIAVDAEVGNLGSSAFGTVVVDGGDLTIGEKLFLARFDDSRTGTIQLNSGNISVGNNTLTADQNGDLIYQSKVVQIGGDNLGTGIMNIAGGNFTVYGNFRVGNAGEGTLNLSGGTLDLTAGNWHNIRVGSGNGAGTVNMTGGTLETKGLTMGKNNVLDTANFNLDGGTLSVIGGFSGAVNLKSNSKLAISDGVFQWEGDRTNAIDSMITSGNITFATTTESGNYTDITPEQSWTSADGNTTLYADYNEVRTNYTTVWASSNDTDGDGLPDAVETNTGIFLSASDTGTDPNDPDTDDDGLADGVETNTGTFVSASDTGTDPHVADTDSDGLSDGAETGTGIFVSASDTGTDPNAVDTDGDGLSDGIETGLDPNTDSAAAIDQLPSTGGGLSEDDLIDLRVGSKLASIANDQATLQVVIEQSDDLGSWSTLQTEDVTVAAPAGTAKQFFRYRMQD